MERRTLSRSSLFCILGSISAVYFPVPAYAATILVPSQVSTIQAAIDEASDGDVIEVAPGTYQELLDFEGKAITLLGTGGPAVTILDGNYAGTIVTFQHDEGNGSVLQGFTLEHGAADFGAGIYALNASPTILDDVFEDNVEYSGGFGAAIAGFNGSPIIIDSYFTGNSCDTQSGSGVLAFVNGSQPVIEDDVFIDNDCTALNITTPSGQAAVVVNNTFAGNTTAILVGQYGDISGKIFRNNLIAFNTVGFDRDNVENNTSAVTWQHNLVYGNTADYEGISDQTGGDGNLSADPLLADWSTGDVHLDALSPAADVGLIAPPSLPFADYYGVQRIYEGGLCSQSPELDIGAAQSQASARPFAAASAMLRVGRGGLYSLTGQLACSAGGVLNMAAADVQVSMSTQSGSIVDVSLPPGSLRHGDTAYVTLPRQPLRSVSIVPQRQNGQYSFTLVGILPAGELTPGSMLTFYIEAQGYYASLTLSCSSSGNAVVCR